MFTVNFFKKRFFLIGILLTFTLLLLVSSCFNTSKKEKRKDKIPRASITCPICGRKLEQSLGERKPVAIKIENDPLARPQSGLDKACLVYEELTEGGITRFLAIFLCNNADPVGPVRSARTADIDLVYPFGAYFSHCGGGRPILEQIKSSGIFDLDELSYPDLYWRSRDRKAPHNLYTSTERLEKFGNSIYANKTSIGKPFSFLSSSEEERIIRETESLRESGKKEVSQGRGGFELVNAVEIPFAKPCDVRYVYDSKTRSFLRFMSGAPHIERTSEKQISVSTVIVQYVTESPSGLKDVRGADTPDLGVVGSGDAEVFTLGILRRGTWVKNSREEHTRFFDSDGNVIKIKKGPIWIELVPVTERTRIY